MATRLYGMNPEDPAYKITDAAGGGTSSKPIELQVDFGALAAFSPTMTGTEAKMLVLQALEKFAEYIEQQHVWPPA